MYSIGRVMENKNKQKNIFLAPHIPSTFAELLSFKVLYIYIYIYIYIMIIIMSILIIIVVVFIMQMNVVDPITMIS